MMIENCAEHVDHVAKAMWDVSDKRAHWEHAPPHLNEIYRHRADAAISAMPALTQAEARGREAGVREAAKRIKEVQWASEEYDDFMRGNNSAITGCVSTILALTTTPTPDGDSGEVHEFSSEVIDAGVWALLGYREKQKDLPGVDWKVERSWTISVVREQMRKALRAALAREAGQ